MKRGSPSGVVSEGEIRPAAAEEIGLVADLFRAYEAWLGISLCFQGFEAEVEGLPGCYAAPAGGLWLAWVAGRAVGVVGLRPLGGGVCEMKRLWVLPEAQGLGLGRRLAEVCVAEAAAKGYRLLALDSLPRLEKAIQLYRGMGFRDAAPRYDGGGVDLVFMEKDLSSSVTERA